MNNKNLTAKLSQALSSPLALVAFVFCSHGMLLLNDGVYWDGWLLHGLHLNRDADSLLSTFQQAGAPWIGYFHLAFWLFPNLILAYKLTAFLSVLLATLMVYILGLRSRIFTARESVFVALIFCVYTGYQVHVELIMAPSFFYFALFLSGIYLVQRSLNATRTSAIVLRVVSLIFLFLSFQISSLLVFYFPFLLWVVVEKWSRMREKSGKTLFLTLLRFIDFLILPFVFWIVRTVFWAPHGVYAGYNSVAFEPANWSLYFKIFFENSVLSQFSTALQSLLNQPALALLFILVCVSIVYALKRKHVEQTQEELAALQMTSKRAAVVAGSIILFSLLLFLFAAFPYVVVGKYPGAQGWESRHALLMSIPVAVGLVGLGRLFFLFIPSRLRSSISIFIGGLLVSGFFLLTINIYLEWQARWIKDLSIITNLKKIPSQNIEKVRVISVKDEYRIGSESYRFYEYAGMFKAAWQEESRVGFAPGYRMDSEKLIQDFPLKHYLLKDFRAGGCQTALRIQRNVPALNNFALVKTYFKYKWFDPNELPTFLEKVTVLHMSDRVCPPAPG